MFILLYIGHKCKKPKLKDIVHYFDDFAPKCKELALELNLSQEKVNAISIDNHKTKDMCYSIFDTYLKMTPSPCWCQIIQALQRIALFATAKKIEEEKLLGNYCYCIYHTVVMCILANTNVNTLAVKKVQPLC